MHEILEDNRKPDIKPFAVLVLFLTIDIVSKLWSRTGGVTCHSDSYLDKFISQNWYLKVDDTTQRTSAGNGGNHSYHGSLIN